MFLHALPAVRRQTTIHRPQDTYSPCPGVRKISMNKSGASGYEVDAILPSQIQKGQGQGHGTASKIWKAFCAQ